MLSSWFALLGRVERDGGRAATIAKHHIPNSALLGCITLAIGGRRGIDRSSVIFRAIADISGYQAGIADISAMLRQVARWFPADGLVAAPSLLPEAPGIKSIAANSDPLPVPPNIRQ